MIFRPLSIAGCFVIEPEFRGDARGRFARVFCSEEFAEHGLETSWAQMNMSVTAQAGTVRGLHFQRAPHAEVKVVRCTSGAVWDVAADLRAGSATFGRWVARELSSETGAMMYIPHGVAHGFQALTDDAELTYLHTAAYTPGHEGGVSVTDPDLAIDWPLSLRNISPRDMALPALTEVVPVI